jgi:hypothetical protein
MLVLRRAELAPLGGGIGALLEGIQRSKLRSTGNSDLEGER